MTSHAFWPSVFLPPMTSRTLPTTADLARPSVTEPLPASPPGTAPWLLFRAATPLGQALLVTDGEGRLRALDWHDHEPRMRTLLARQYRHASPELQETHQAPAAHAALLRYFSGELHVLDTLPVALGGTDFQRLVWRTLRDIPPGQTLSYAELARRIGRPAAIRAVGLANGANPISLALPCHRVIGSNAALTGYGGGLHRKQWLLEHEHALPLRPAYPLNGTLPGF